MYRRTFLLRRLNQVGQQQTARKIGISRNTSQKGQQFLKIVPRYVAAEDCNYEAKRQQPPAKAGG